MNLDEADRLVAIKRVPHEEGNGRGQTDESESDDTGTAVTEPGPDSANG
jgi:hypothetical protein